MVKRALCLAMPEVGHSRCQTLVCDSVNEKIRVLSERWAEAVT
jgi:hypothetical protein